LGIAKKMAKSRRRQKVNRLFSGLMKEIWVK
jgi:hypothetical protein